MKARTAILLIAALLAPGALAKQAQPSPEDEPLYAGMRLLQAQTAEDKRAFVSAQLQLDEAQAAKFWPIFEAHQQGLAELNRRRLDNVLAYARAWNDDSLDDAILDFIVAERFDEARLDAMLNEHQDPAKILDTNWYAIKPMYEKK